MRGIIRIMNSAPLVRLVLTTEPKGQLAVTQPLVQLYECRGQGACGVMKIMNSTK